MKGGAVDFLTKTVDARALLGAIERAVAKRPRRRGNRPEHWTCRAASDPDSEGGAQVFALVVTGMLNKQVARPGHSREDRQGARARVMEKMRAGSLAELVRLADRAGIIAKPDLLSPSPSVAAPSIALDQGPIPKQAPPPVELQSSSMIRVQDIR